jgi:hypothetical protein
MLGGKHMTNKAKKRELDRTKSEIDAILRRVDSLPVLDSRPEDEILGYDSNGVPTNLRTTSDCKE